MQLGIVDHRESRAVCLSVKKFLLMMQGTRFTANSLAQVLVMLIVVSPSKTQAFTTPRLHTQTQPRHLALAEDLVARMRQLDRQELARLLQTSDKLTEAAAAKLAAFTTPFTAENASPALFTFTGDAYAALRPNEYGEQELDHAQGHLRILSGLYGVLRPLDLMQPYRLEMATSLPTGDCPNLYQFWSAAVTQDLAASLGEQGGPLVNLASGEYLRVIDQKRLGEDVITPVFRQFHGKSKTYKTIAIHAKRARGQMLDYLISNRLNQAKELQNFDRDGYRFQPETSTDTRWVFDQLS
jgi:cytoplasmic iron level regulating protein YaaA (DUF328/UPF0246 family)